MASAAHRLWRPKRLRVLSNRLGFSAVFRHQKKSPASAIIWSTKLKGLIVSKLKLANKCCAPPLASKTPSRLVIASKLKLANKYCAPPLASKTPSRLVIASKLKLANKCCAPPLASKTRSRFVEPVRVLGRLSTPKKIPRIYDAGDCFWRRRRDSNPRYAINVYTLSRGAPSATRPLLHKLFIQPFHLEIQTLSQVTPGTRVDS